MRPKPTFLRQQVAVLSLYACYVHVCKCCGIPAFPPSCLCPEFRDIFLKGIGGGSEKIATATDQGKATQGNSDEMKPLMAGAEKEEENSTSSHSEEQNNEHRNHNKLRGMTTHGLCFVIWTFVVRVIDAFWRLDIYSSTPTATYPASYAALIFEVALRWAFRSIRSACYALGIPAPAEINCLPSNRTNKNAKRLDGSGSDRIETNGTQEQNGSVTRISFPRIAYDSTIRELGTMNYWCPGVFLDRVREKPRTVVVRLKHPHKEQPPKAAKRFFRFLHKEQSAPKIIHGPTTAITTTTAHMYVSRVKKTAEASERERSERRKVHKMLISVVTQLAETHQNILFSTVMKNKLTIDGLVGMGVDVYNSFLKSTGHFGSTDGVKSREVVTGGLRQTPLSFTLRSCHFCVVADLTMRKNKRKDDDTQGNDVFAFVPYTGSMFCEEDPDGLGDNVHYACDDLTREERNGMTNNNCLGVSMEGSYSLNGSLYASELFSHIIRGGVMMNTVPLKVPMVHNGQQVFYNNKQAKRNDNNNLVREKILIHSQTPKEPCALSFFMKDVKVKICIPILRYSRYLNIREKYILATHMPTPLFRIPPVKIAAEFPDISLSFDVVSGALNDPNITSISSACRKMQQKADSLDQTTSVFSFYEQDIAKHCSGVCAVSVESKGNSEEEPPPTKIRSYACVIVLIAAGYKDAQTDNEYVGLISRASLTLAWDNDPPEDDQYKILIVRPGGLNMSSIPFSIILGKQIVVGDMREKMSGVANTIGNMFGNSVKTSFSDDSELYASEAFSQVQALPLLIDLTLLPLAESYNDLTSQITIPSSAYRKFLPCLRFSYAGVTLPLEITARSRVKD